MNDCHLDITLLLIAHVHVLNVGNLHKDIYSVLKIKLETIHFIEIYQLTHMFKCHPSSKTIKMLNSYFKKKLFPTYKVIIQ